MENCTGQRGTPTSRPREATVAEDTYDPATRPSSLKPSSREPGPPKPETEEQLARSRKESRELVKAMLGGGIEKREVASMADIRGYRLYRKRYFGQAQAWFEAAARTDPTYEPALFNAAKVAALRGKPDLAQRHLRKLRSLKTPLSRSRLDLVPSDPDFSSLEPTGR